MAIIHTVTQDILSRVNGEIYESASLVSDDLLTGLFRALFRVERATEFSEPDVFGASDDPSLLMDKRMSAAHWKYLPVFISNDEILAKRFQLFTEYDFVFVADLTPSMTYRWRDLYVGQTGMSENADFLPADVSFTASDYSSTKMFILKYLLYAFLLSSVRFGFRSRVIFFTMDDSITLSGVGEEFPFQAVDFVDRYLMDADNVNAWDVVGAHASPCERVLQELMETRTESVMVLATDFMDVAHGRLTEEQMDPYLAELRYRHRLSVLQINDPREVNTLENRDDRPSSSRWAFQRNVETPDEGGIGKQRYYRAAARNREFMEHCRRLLGTDDLLNGSIAERLARRGITTQKFVYGHGADAGNRIEQRLQEVGSWLEEA